MDENYDVLEEDLDRYRQALEKAVDDLMGLEPGSEQYERQAKAIAELRKAEAEETKAENDLKMKKGQFWVGVAQAAVGVLGVVASIFGIAMQRKTNQDVMRFEEEDVITSKAFDNKSRLR